MKRIVSLGLLCMILIIAQVGCGKKEEKKISDDGFYLDTECRIDVFTDDGKKGHEIIKKAFDICGEYENKMSKTIAGSDVYRINNAGGEPVRVSDETKEVIELGLKMSEESDGRFDITVGRLTDLWDFKSKASEVPSKEKIDAAVKTVGYRQVKIKDNDISISGGKAEIDLGGIAKGYISAKVARFLKEEGISHAIINFGGNVVTIGSKPDGAEWNVGVQVPNAERNEVIGSIKAVDQAVITSGIYERKFEVNGKVYHHIIDPKTGYPVKNDIVGVTLKCPADKAARCDAYSTICLLMGSREGKSFIESKDGFEALLYTKTGKKIRTEGMDIENADLGENISSS